MVVTGEAAQGEVSQIFTVDRTQLAARIGKLSKRRVLEILAGVRLVLEPIDP